MGRMTGAVQRASASTSEAAIAEARSADVIAKARNESAIVEAYNDSKIARTCDKCGRVFDTRRGMRLHTLRFCKKTEQDVGHDVGVETTGAESETETTEDEDAETAEE